MPASKRAVQFVRVGALSKRLQLRLRGKRAFALKVRLDAASDLGDKTLYGLKEVEKEVRKEGSR